MKNIILCLYSLLFLSVYSQSYQISDGGTVTTCSGSIFDSGGNGGNYGPNENYTMTFCSDDPNQVLQFDFFELNLLGYGTLGAGDSLLFYSGSSATGQPIYTVTELDFQETFQYCNGILDPFFGCIGTIENSSPPLRITAQEQCVTLVFKSDNNGEARGWEGIISCATPPTGCGANSVASDIISTAPPICDLNGYCGNTTDFFGSDNYNEIGDQFSGSLENNSWVSFIAADNSIEMDVDITNCVNNQGVQIGIYSQNSDGTFTRMSTDAVNGGNDLTGQASIGNITINAENLTLGEEYYVMIDGFAGDICEYTITAEAGVQTLDLTSTDPLVYCDSDVPSSINTINLDASGISAVPGTVTYTWTDNHGTTNQSGIDLTSITADLTQTTTYYVNAVGGEVCDDVTAEITITVEPQSVLTLDYDLSFCTTDQIEPNSYSSSIGNGTFSLTSSINSDPATIDPNTGVITNASAGATYSVTYSTGTGVCYSEEVISNIVVTDCSCLNDDATFSYPVVEECLDSNNILPNNIVSPNGTFSSSSNDLIVDPNTGEIDLTNSLVGSYTITYTTDGCNTTSDVDFEIKVNPELVVNNVSNACEGENVTIDASGADSYTWNSTPGSNQSNFILNTDTTIIITGEIRGCFDSETINITVNELLDPSFTTTNFCENGTPIALGSVANQGTFIVIPSNNGETIDATLTPQNFQAGIYTIRNITDNNGCLDSVENIIEVFNIPNPEITGNIDICSGDSSLLQLNESYASYQWSTGETTPEIYVDGTTTPINVIVTDINNCTASTNDVYINTANSPVVTISVSETETEYTLVANGADNYSWTPTNSLSCLTCETTIAKPNGIETFTVIGTNEFGCVDTSSVTLEWDLSFVIPNMFTPNNDGVNDVFFIDNPRLYRVTMKFYNRWGNLVYETEDWTTGWSGVNEKDTMVKDGIYYYNIDVETTPGNMESYSGSITIQK